MFEKREELVALADLRSANKARQAEWDADWKPILARALKISPNDLIQRPLRRAFGTDLSSPTNDLFAFAWDQGRGDE